MPTRLVLALVAALTTADIAASRTLPEPPRRDDSNFQHVVKVAPRVWVLAEPRFQVQPVGNVTVIEQTDGVVLIDAGGSPGSARRIVQAVRSLSAKPVKAVVITHWHGDHPQGLSEILKAWPNARTIATRATQAHLRNPRTMNTPAVPDPAAEAALRKLGQSYIAFADRKADEANDPREKTGWSAAGRLFRQYTLDMQGAVTLSTAESFDDGLDLPDRLAPVQLRFLGRANTDGDAVAWLPKQKVLVTGDIVVAPFPFGFGSYPADWVSTLAKLRAYDFKALVPGHGLPQRDHTYINRLSGALADVRAQVAPLAVQGLPLEEVRRRTDFSAQVSGFAGDDPWLRRWVTDYWITPIVASAYKEARGQPIIQDLRGE